MECIGLTGTLNELPETGSEQLGSHLNSDSSKEKLQDSSSDNAVVYVAVPLMLLFSSAIMATAWLGHLRFKEELSFGMATLFAWLLVLPEYALNITALRLGYRKFTGGQMGAFRLCTGVFCIAIVSHYLLGEGLTPKKLAGFVIMSFSMILISNSNKKKDDS